MDQLRVIFIKIQKITPLINKDDLYHTEMQKYIFILTTKKNTGMSIVCKVATPLVFTEKKTACKNIKESTSYGCGG